MELSAELFVLDNLLMDLLMLRLAAAIGALRLLAEHGRLSAEVLPV